MPTRTLSLEKGGLKDPILKSEDLFCWRERSIPYKDVKTTP